MLTSTTPSNLVGMEVRQNPPPSGYSNYKAQCGSCNAYTWTTNTVDWLGVYSSTDMITFTLSSGSSAPNAEPATLDNRSEGNNQINPPIMVTAVGLTLLSFFAAFATRRKRAVMYRPQSKPIALCLILTVLASSILISCSSGVGQQWCANAATASFDLKNINLNSVSMTSATEGWAVGANVLLHYKDDKWWLISDEQLTTLMSVSMLSSDVGLTVGHGYFASGYERKVFRYQDGCWQKDSAVPTEEALPRAELGANAIPSYSLGGW